MNRKIKNGGLLGIAMTLVVGAVLPLVGMTQGSVYAQGTQGGTILLYEDGQVKSELSDTEIQLEAEQLVTMIKRLEITPEYLKMYDVWKVEACMKYPENDVENSWQCERRTNSDDMKAVVSEVLSGDALESAIAAIDRDGYLLAGYLIPQSHSWNRIIRQVKNVYADLRKKAGDETSGITSELTTENVTKLLQSENDWYTHMYLTELWEGLAELTVNTTAGKLGRLVELVKNDSTYMTWPYVVWATYDAERLIGTEYEQDASNALSSALAQFVDTYGMPIQEKIAAAKDLSDWGQGVVLYNAMDKVYPWTYGRGPLWLTYYPALNAEMWYTEAEQQEILTTLETTLEMMYPGSTNGLYDYRLVLAELPTAPNSGSLGEELSGMLVKVAVVSVAGVAVVFGGAVTAKRYLFSPLKRRK